MNPGDSFLRFEKKSSIPQDDSIINDTHMQDHTINNMSVRKFDAFMVEKEVNAEESGYGDYVKSELSLQSLMHIIDMGRCSMTEEDLMDKFHAMRVKLRNKEEYQ